MSVTFLLASASCLLAAAVIWPGLCLASRAWPVLAANRSVWLLSQAAIAAVFVLALLPQRAEYSVLPAIEIARPVAAAATATSDRGDALEMDGEADEVSWVELAAQAWLALYCAGLMAAGVRWYRARRTLDGLLATACELDGTGLAGHAGLARELPAGLRVFETDAAISPMLIGLVNARLLLPTHLRSFPPEQQRLIVAHELTHFARRDPTMLYASLLLQTVFWFNPILRMLGRKLHWAQELGCDREVLAGRPPHQRQHYAAALVAQLKLQQGNLAEPAAAMAFGGMHAATIVARVRLIRDDGLHRLGMAGKATLALSLAGLLGASVLLQPALAWHVEQPAASPPALTPPSLPVLAAWARPLDKVRVTSFYDAPRKNGRPHRGIDFAARKGTPVHAVGDGIVRESTDQFTGGEIYGKVVTIEHANGLHSFYAHLDQRSVVVGEAVKAGQLIGKAGETGRATGPHLHLEAFEGAQRIDPQRLLAGLDAHATGQALRLRPAASF